MSLRNEPRRMERVLGALALLASGIAGTTLPRGAHGQEHAFAGSAQISYTYVPTAENPRALGFDGFLPEVSLKMTADVNDHISAQVKVCYGCHGFELAMAFIDLRVADELNFRIGRFNPSFGEFPLRQDPANHAAIDRPLPYDMGRMLRMREWNLGIVPVPYADTGVEVNGTHWFGEAVQLDYAAYAVGGFRGTSDGSDLDFIQSRSAAVYYVDNNSEPAFGGRTALTITPSTEVVMTLGASAMYGRYDPEGQRDYLVLGADAYLRFDRLILRGEYLVRRTELNLTSDPSAVFQYGPGADGVYDRYVVKHGWYAEAELELGEHLRVLGRYDGLRRDGNVAIGSELRSISAVRRYTLGVNVLPHPAFRVKLFGEVYDFSDFADEVSIQAALAAAF